MLIGACNPMLCPILVFRALLQICDKLAAQQVTKTLNAYVDLWRGAGRKRLDMDGIGTAPS